MLDGRMDEQLTAELESMPPEEFEALQVQFPTSFNLQDNPPKDR